MTALNELVDDFLAQKRIAVAGVSRGGNDVGNILYKKLKNANYTVFPINPNATEVEGDKCYPNLQSIPDGVDAVMIATHPNVTDQIVRNCAESGVSRVWIHRSFGQGSFSQTALDYCRAHGISVIPAGCPMMFVEPDIAHKCMRWFLGVTGGIPKDV
jgi:predicted CoA-binding protein